MEENLVRMANELFQLCCKAIKKEKRISFRLSNIGVFCRIDIGDETYELYRNRDLYRNSLINYRDCLESLRRIIEKPQT